METKPLPALESTGQAAPANPPDATPDDMDNDTPEPTPEPESPSDDESVEGHSADPA
jgi:hypothetical protein